MRSTFPALILAVVFGLSIAAMASAQTPDPPKVVRWEKDATTAYNKALQEKKGLVVVFVCPLIQDKCVHCKRFRASLFADEFNSLAGEAIFVQCEIDVRSVYKPAPSEDDKKVMAWDRDDGAKPFKHTDEAGVNLFKLMRCDATPTVSILEPNASVVAEIARLRGYFDAKGLRDNVQDVLTKWKENGSKITPPPQMQQ